jgi:TRAP-type C4-dicarboxylate transport system permease small subunit
MAFLARLPRIFVGVALVLAIGVMLAGVFLRYIAVPIAEALDVTPINFFWVEETGETLLIWMTLVGAAAGIAERTHFTVSLLVHHLPEKLQRGIAVAIHLVMAAFGCVLAWEGWQVTVLNLPLESPALEISLAWMYGAAVVGGVLIVLFALASHAAPPQPTLPPLE